jgi:hypothetical protein
LFIFIVFLFFASKYDYINIVKVLIDNKATSCMYALNIAIIKKHMEIVNMLIPRLNQQRIEKLFILFEQDKSIINQIDNSTMDLYYELPDVLKILILSFLIEY